MAIYIDPENVRFEKDKYGKDHLCFSASGEMHDHALINPIFPPKWDELQKKISDIRDIVVCREKYKKGIEKGHLTVRIHPKDGNEIYIQCEDISGLPEYSK